MCFPSTLPASLCAAAIHLHDLATASTAHIPSGCAKLRLGLANFWISLFLYHIVPPVCYSLHTLIDECSYVHSFFPRHHFVRDYMGRYRRTNHCIEEDEHIPGILLKFHSCNLIDNQSHLCYQRFNER